MSYENFSYYYDSLMYLKFYDDYLKFICDHALFDDVFELACGTGEIAIRLAKTGKDVYASDLSMDMLEVAKQKAMEENVSLIFQRVDMTDFKTNREVDLILCLCDSMNYLLDKQQIIQTFKNVYQSLKQVGSFIFDWKVELLDNGYVKHQVYIEDRIENDIVNEFHYQKTYEIDQYIQWLHDVGFHNISYYGDFEEYHKECERIIFVCQKG